MDVVVEARKVGRSLALLGRRRLLQLAAAGVSIAAAVGLAGYLASRPSFETLYAGLDAQDLARVTSVLRETNVAFDVSPDGGAVMVEYGQAPRARMALAERGLPRSATAGYELFDKLGSLGLTSFMQELTRVRALEGELARSIQSMQGVRAARVHIAPQDEGGFRRTKQAASASVIVRLSSSAERNLAHAIRRLVSAATPGLAIDAVTVLNSDGSVLAAGGDAEQSAANQTLGLEKSLSDALQDNVRQILAPIVGVKNLNVSVALRINTDKRQVNETVFNPESRVERSVRVTKENQTAQNSNAQAPTSVERNIPNDKGKTDGKVSNEENSKKEELTNYEISSKSVQTVGGGYAVERISVAVLINKSSMTAGLDSKEQTAIDRRLAELTDLASTAVGLSKDRGDSIKVNAIEFVDGAGDLAAVGEPGLLSILMRQAGSIFNAFALIGVAAVAGFVAYRVLMRESPSHLIAQASQVEHVTVGLPAPERDELQLAKPEGAGIAQGQRKRARQRLEALIEADEDQAARVIKDWLRAEGREIHENA